MLRKLRYVSVPSLFLAGLMGAKAAASDPPPASRTGDSAHKSEPKNTDDNQPADAAGDDVISDSELRLMLQQDQQPVAPVPQPVEPTVRSPLMAGSVSAALFGPAGVSPSLLSEVRRSRAAGPATDVVIGSESKVRATTDAGNLLGKSIQTRGLAPQNRTPIITDTRVRGSGVGNLLASGSFWVPARQDLDTMLSKIDSRIVSDVIVVKGPYSAIYGPGTQFIDINLLQSPRFADGYETHGSTSIEYKTNGEQWYGRQTIWGGDDDWGFRIGSGIRTGNDYTMGNDDELPTSYKSRDIDVTLGFDLSEDEHIEFSYLRLDQTDVESPGQFFDIDFLVTDAFELTYTLDNQCYFDRFTLETWYNRTRFEGDASRSGKLNQIPSIPLVTNNLATDVDSMSTGYSTALTWGQPGEAQLTVGTDLRYLEQELNEINDFSVDVDAALAALLGIAPGIYNFFNANSPILRSHWSNPGIFAQTTVPANDCLTVRGGARVDWLSTNVEGTPPGLSSTLPTQVPLTRDFLLNQLRTNSFDRDFDTWAVYGTAEYKVDEHWTLGTAAGVGMRPPTLTELYSTGEFLSVIQNGFNSVIGNPNLDPARHTQLDISVRANYEHFRAGATGFYAWVKDFITYEVVLFNALPEENTRAMTYVNTPFVTLSGFETYAEYDVNCWLTPFATMSFVEGRDHTRSQGGQDFYNPAIAQFFHDPNAPRGILPGSDEEPLPGIPPLESRVGFRIHDPCPQPTWGVEFGARIVDNQDRVASSIVELATPGFTTYDIRGFWRACDNLTLISGVENLTDKFYREHLDLRTGRGVFQPGINFYFGAEVTY